MTAHKFLYLFLLILTFSLAIKAQEAYKFREPPELRWDISEVYAVHEFALELEKLSDVKGLILVSGVRGTSLRYAEAVKRFTTTHYKINPGRILISYAGAEDERRKMELWILPKNASEPLAISGASYKNATYFDYYTWGCELCEGLNRDTLKMFAEELKKYPETNAYIIVHPSTREYSEVRNHRQALIKGAAGKKSLNKLGIKMSRIFVAVGEYQAGDYGEYAALWIVPPDAEPPESTLKK